MKRLHDGGTARLGWCGCVLEMALVRGLEGVRFGFEKGTGTRFREGGVDSATMWKGTGALAFVKERTPVSLHGLHVWRPRERGHLF